MKSITIITATEKPILDGTLVSVVCNLSSALLLENFPDSFDGVGILG